MTVAVRIGFATRERCGARDARDRHCRRSPSRPSPRSSQARTTSRPPGRSRSPDFLAPGVSQLLFTFAIRSVGASRTSVVVGAAPLAAVAIAFVVLGEPVSAPLVLGAIAIVAGGVALIAERRPEHLRASGLVLAGALHPALRDARQPRAPPRRLELGAADGGRGRDAARRAASSPVSTRGGCRARGACRVFAPAGICFGLSYVCLFEAYYRGRVSVVSPLVATETLWGVGLSVLLLRRSELVGRRLLAGAALIVAGGVLIGIYR